jgi:hypothetical protein
LGVIALITPSWISINHNQTSTQINYDLFRQCKINETECTDINSFRRSQYFVIIGFTILIIGLLAGVICTALIDKRSIHFIVPIILIIGTAMILLGFIFYIQSVVENIDILSNTKLDLGYSMILMISTCITGFILTAYFAFSAGYIHRHILGIVNIH